MTNMPHKQNVKIADLLRTGAILEIQDGNHGNDHPKSSDYVKSGIPFVMSSDIKNCFVDLKNCKFLSKEKADKLRIGFSKTGDVLLTHKGNVGDVAVVPNIEPYIMLTPQVTYYRVNDQKLHNKYLVYAFSSPGFQNQLKSFSAQSTRPYIGITTQRQLQITVYPLPTQHKIASILSAYDDLIENNTRRIQILEEMAQMIYREWFVHFRFPGYEQVRMVNSEMGEIPEGWEVKKLGEEIELAYGKALKAADRVEGAFPVYGSAGVVGSHNTSLVKAPGIIVGRKGNVGLPVRPNLEVNRRLR